jgi:hypothetical protein
MLFHIRGDINIKATLVSNIIPAVPSKGMQVVLNQPCATCASQFADLVRMTLELAKQQDFTSNPIDSDFNLGHVKDPCIPYAPREFCNQEGYQS